jgi:hypothetical protein
MPQIRGLFPFPLAQPAEGGGVVVLGQGGTWYPPAGEWLVQTGTSCAIQWWDPIGQTWRNQVSASNIADYFSTDGANYRMVNLTGNILSAPITAAGSTGTNGIGFAQTGAAIAFSAPGSGGVQATGYVIVGGSVAAPTVTQAGSGFVVPPLIVIDPPPPGGIQATASAVMTAFTGAGTAGIASITMANVGAGYLVSPNFYVIPQMGYYGGGPSGGVAAAQAAPPPGLVFPANAVPGNQNTSSVGTQLTGIALTGSGTVTGLVMINYGSVYTGTPTATITGVGAATTTLAAVTAAAVTTSFVQPRVQ